MKTRAVRQANVPNNAGLRRPRARRKPRYPGARFDRSGLSVLAVAGLLGSAACERSSPGDAELERESQRLQRSTAPARSQVVERRSAVSEPLALVREWRVSTPDAFPLYAGLVQKALAASYSCAPPTERQMTCFRSLPGDRLRLVLSAERTGPGARVLVRFEAKPD